LAIVNSLSGETAEMVEDYKIGVNYKSEHSLYKALLVLTSHLCVLEEMRGRALHLAEHLDIETIYQPIIEPLLALV
jgi:hypothetical protein